MADGCIIEGEVENSILFRGVRVEKGAKVCGCVLMQGTAVQAGAVLKYAITDKNVRVNPGRMLMGHNTYPLSIAKNENCMTTPGGRYPPLDTRSPCRPLGGTMAAIPLTHARAGGCPCRSIST